MRTYTFAPFISSQSKNVKIQINLEQKRHVSFSIRSFILGYHKSIIVVNVYATVCSLVCQTQQTHLDNLCLNFR